MTQVLFSLLFFYLLSFVCFFRQTPILRLERLLTKWNESVSTFTKKLSTATQAEYHALEAGVEGILALYGVGLKAFQLYCRESEGYH